MYTRCDCGLRHGVRAGERVELAVARRAAADPAARIGVLFVKLGTRSDVDSVLSNQHGLSPEITRRFDIVGYDRRGLGGSHPVVCSADLVAQLPDPILASRDDLERWRKLSQRLTEDCRSHTPARCSTTPTRRRPRSAGSSGTSP